MSDFANSKLARAFSLFIQGGEQQSFTSSLFSPISSRASTMTSLENASFDTGSACTTLDEDDDCSPSSLSIPPTTHQQTYAETTKSKVAVNIREKARSSSSNNSSNSNSSQTSSSSSKCQAKTAKIENYRAYAVSSEIKDNQPKPSRKALGYSINSERSSCIAVLPCRCFISTGTCAYGDKCAFIHDSRIASSVSGQQIHNSKKKKISEGCSENSSKIYRNNTTNHRDYSAPNLPDSFFWPPVPYADHVVLQSENLYHAANIKLSDFVKLTRKTYMKNIYDNTNGTISLNAVCVYSMWFHFTTFIKSLVDNEEERKERRSNHCNEVMGTKRLNIFVKLSST